MTAFTPDRLREVEFNLLVAEQLHDSVPCESTEGCNRPAAWSLVCPECREILGMLCGPHRARSDREAERAVRRHAELSCQLCDAPMSLPLPWVAI